MLHLCQKTPTLLRKSTTNVIKVAYRHKSIRAAIERGINHSERSRGSSQSQASRSYPGQASRRNIPGLSRGFREDRDPRSSDTGSFAPRHRNTSRGHWKDRDEGSEQRGIRSTSRRWQPSERDGVDPRQRNNRTEGREHRDGSGQKQYVPESLPYTTSASEFLYGYSVVQAALRANRRQLYNLYVHTRGANHEGNAALIMRARAAGVKIHNVGDEYLRLLDKTSSGRPHNGFILEASPLPRSPIKALGASSVTKEYFSIALDKQSKEDAAVNGMDEQYKYKSSGWRHPLILYVDGVLDEGNLGATARSAYFLGVDAIITPTRQSAPWSQVALKASAGAAEAIPIFTVAQPADFLMQSAREGWRIYASDAVPPEEQRPLLTTPPSREEPAADLSSRLVFTYARSSKRPPPGHYPVNLHPTILMMGAEGSGLRASLLNHAHFKVGILAGRDVDEVGVDSLNVSVAASLLCFGFLQKPKPAPRTGDLLF